MALGNSSFGFSGAGGGGVTPIIGGGTLNYLAKFTPDGTTIGNSLLFDNGVSVGLGTNTPDASSVLDLTSTTKGMLAPRMTTVQRDAIAAPVNALLIYNITTSSFNYYNGLTWVDFSSTVVTSPFTTSTSVIDVGDNFQTVAQKTQGQINQIISSLPSNSIYMFSGTNSDISGYKSMPLLANYTAGVLASTSQIVTTTPTLIEEFATPSGYPNVTSIPSGIITVHFETEKVAGSNNYYSFAEIYKRTSGGVETLLATTDNSTETAVNTRVQVTISAFLSNVSYLNVTDRIVVKVYCVMLSASATIGVYYDNNTDARLQLPTVSVDLSNYVTLAGVQTLTNKRITPRVTSIVSSANPTVDTDATDFVDITAQAEAIVSMTTNLSGNATNGQRLTYRIKDNGVSRAINWGASFEQCGVALPTSTPAGKRLNVGFIYDTTTSKWGCVAALPEL